MSVWIGLLKLEMRSRLKSENCDETVLGKTTLRRSVRESYFQGFKNFAGIGLFVKYAGSSWEITFTSPEDENDSSHSPLVRHYTGFQERWNYGRQKRATSIFSALWIPWVHSVVRGHLLAISWNCKSVPGGDPRARLNGGNTLRQNSPKRWQLFFLSFFSFCKRYISQVQHFRGFCFFTWYAPANQMRARVSSSHGLVVSAPS